ncbi:MAG: acetyl-CoA carboxylase carboxyltransferase subunit alpha [candidate division WOR-3 bacterium]|nr:acetyl-CoA carboxylase carboxyltransferase subunit alpha [candidate division WOR-3 bacterium]MCX7947619.1 acetyl-CoA carboxylase carboxyltransferase subunit alpha [candidate division WOR-3 bacterium]MDW8150371.1 acetyl-CoA carboxylase carboxyltransferase subunit alpha [candidate division WOR-3 bacterium]
MRPLDFEKPLYDILEKIRELETNPSLKDSVDRLKKEAEKLKEEIYSNLTRWQIVQIARHQDRPKSLDYLNNVLDEFLELHGDRLFSDDSAIIVGIGKIDKFSIAFIAQEKGKTTNEKIERNFGMPHPEGYRKGMRIMDLAEKLKLPIITFVDTPGAYPGIGAEERGQFSAIAYSIMKMLSIKTPTISYIIGEGGSGGALAIAAADRVFALEYSIYSVISPEGCASILFRDASKAEKAADILKLTARDLLELGVIDGIVKEPLGGAHWQPKEMYKNLKEHIIEQLYFLKNLDIDEILKLRYEKYRRVGIVYG